MDKVTLKYITLELIEKIYRLESFIIKNSSKGDNNSNEAVIIIIKKSITCLLSNIDNLTKDINDIDSKSTSNEIFSIQRSLSQCYLAIKELHKELNFLSTNWLKLETYTFVEQIYEKHFKVEKTPKINIILSDKYTFTETNLDEKFERIMDSFFEKHNLYNVEESPTVIIPKIEYSNPLNWTILVHELGHIDIVNIKKFISNDSMFPDNLSKGEKEKLISWAEEIYCDIIAIKIIGPAYFLSLASFALLESLDTGYGVSSHSHPPFAMRLALLYAYLDKNKLEIKTNLPTGVDGAIHSFIYSMNQIANRNLKNIEKSLGQEPSIKKLMVFYKYLRNELIKDDNECKIIEPIFDLVENLKEMIPIGSYRSHEMDKSNLTKLELNELSKEEFNQIRNSLTERNTELWEIINSGWVYKIKEIIPFGFELFFDKTELTIKEKVIAFGEKLELLDDRLLVSIETSKLIDLIEN